MNPELAKLLGELMAGLSVPGSIGVLGAADKPWRQLRERWHLFGYGDADEITQQILEVEIAQQSN